MLQTKDTTYFFAILGLWANVEISMGIICGCLPIFPKFFQVLGPRVSYIFKTSISMQHRPKRFGSSGFSAKLSEGNRSTSATRGLYELQDECQVDKLHGSNQRGKNSSTVNDEDRPRVPSSENSKTDVEDVESGRKKNRILKTVVIETRRERRRSLDVDVEVQLSNLGW